ncbi:AraC-like DNA-binding protein [Mesorhizobium abyssinicae]
MLILEPETVEALARDRCEGSGSPLFRTPIVRGGDTRSKLAALMDVHELIPDLLDEELVGFMSHLIAQHGGGDRGHEAPDDATALAVVRDMLIDEPFRSRSLADLSAACNLSRTYLVTAFKRRYGLPPMAFQLQHRLDRARRDLLHGDRPIAQIAIENGFYDQSDLNHHFSRIFAISPFRMRRQVRDSRRT